MRRMMPLLCLVCWGFLSSPLTLAAPPEGVDRAVEAGVAYLKALQRDDGTWPRNEIGATALAGLTLLECAVPANDPAIQAAADAVRRASIDLTHTYSLALSVLFLDRLGEPVDVALIESMVVRLMAGQNSNGGWTYTCPNIPESEVRRLSNLLGQRNELVAGRNLPRAGSTEKRTARDLPIEIQQQLKLINQNQPNGARAGRDDNSNTQFATLAMWVGRRYGLPTDQAITRLNQRFRSSQNPDGGWGYSYVATNTGGRLNSRSTATMTCAGLLGLAVAYGAANDPVLRTDPKGKEPAKPAKPQFDPAKDAAVRAGLLALSTIIDNPVGGLRGRPAPAIAANGRMYYFLWSLERVAVAFGLQTIGNKDWYAWGAEILVANQNGDGSWSGAYAQGPDTCFALLFLKRANLARDLTASLKGAVQDPGEAVLKAGGIGGADLVPGKTKLDLSNDDEPSETPKRPPEEKPLETPRPPRNDKPVEAPRRVTEDKPAPKKEQVPPLDDAKEAVWLADALMRATTDKQPGLLDQLRDNKGAPYTTALAQAIPKLNGPIKTAARDALAVRLTRMTPTTLKDKLQDDDGEVRRAATLAVAMKDDPSFVPRLIEMLKDSEPPVARAAQAALKSLTNQDLGADPAAWKEWSARQGKK